jgi:hypothetical protein
MIQLSPTEQVLIDLNAKLRTRIAELERKAESDERGDTKSPKPKKLPGQIDEDDDENKDLEIDEDGNAAEKEEGEGRRRRNPERHARRAECERVEHNTDRRQGFRAQHYQCRPDAERAQTSYPSCAGRGNPSRRCGASGSGSIRARCRQCGSKGQGAGTIKAERIYFEGAVSHAIARIGAFEHSARL